VYQVTPLDMNQIQKNYQFAIIMRYTNLQRPCQRANSKILGATPSTRNITDIPPVAKLLYIPIKIPSTDLMGTMM